MPPKDLQQPSPQDAGLSNQSAEVTKGQNIPQIPPKVFNPTPLSEFSRRYIPTLNEDLKRRTDEFNRAISPINERLRTNGLTPAMAIELIQLDGRLDFGALDLINQAVRVAAVDLGFIDAYVPRRDIRAAVTFSEFGIDPRIVIKEYRDFPWEKAIVSTLRAGESLPAKPSFTTFARIILHSAVLLKSRELYEKAREIESTINPKAFLIGPGYRGGGGRGYGQMTPKEQADYKNSGQYKWAEQAIKNAADNLDQPTTGALRELSQPVWSLLVSNLANGEIKKLASTIAVVNNSEFVDDILERTKPVQVSNPYGTRFQYPKVDLATLIKPKTSAPK